MSAANQVSDGVAAVMMLGGIGCAAFVALTVNSALTRRGMTAVLRWLAALVGAPFGFLAGAMLAMPLHGSIDGAVAIVSFAVGLLVLTPFVVFWRWGRNTKWMSDLATGLRGELVLLGDAWRTQRAKAKARESERKAAQAAKVQAARVTVQPVAIAPAVPDSDRPEQSDSDSSDHSPFAAEYQFDYRTADGEVEERIAFITHMSHPRGGVYFEGYRTDTMEKRSYRVDRVASRMIDTATGTLYTAAELAALFGVPAATVYTREYAPTFSTYEPSASPGRAGWRTGVCFLGFGGRKLDELANLANAADWKVFGDVSRHVDYVVVNGRAGARQRSRAEESGATVIDEDSFRAMV